MCYQPAARGALVVGEAYYVLDRLADPTELVTLVSTAGRAAVVRGARGLEYPVAAVHLSQTPADQFYQQLRLHADERRRGY